MAQFTIIPRDPSFPAREIILASDEKEVFRLLEQLGWQEAYVLKDNTDAFTIKRQEAGPWIIAREEGETTAKQEP